VDASMVIRPAVMDDIPGLVRLWIPFMDYHAELDSLLTRSPEGADNWARYISGRLDEERYGVFVAEEEGDLVGYTVAFVNRYPPIWTVEACGFIDEIFVDPAQRGRGIGRDLYLAAEKWLLDKGMPHIELKVDVANHPSRTFWMSLGFAPRVEIMTKRFGTGPAE